MSFISFKRLSLFGVASAWQKSSETSSRESKPAAETGMERELMKKEGKKVQKIAMLYALVKYSNRGVFGIKNQNYEQGEEWMESQV